MENQDRGPQIKINALQGIDLRSSKTNMQNGSADRIWGLFPGQSGLQRRIPGKYLLRYVEGVPFNGGVQTFSGTGQFIFQGGPDLYAFTLDELLNRQQPFSLTRVPSTPEEDMSYALLAHTEAVSTNGGSLGAADYTFYQAKLNTELVDADNIVTLSSNQFTLATGFYRITAICSFGAPSTLDGVQCYAGLWSVTGADWKHYSGTSTDIFSTAGWSADPASNSVNGTVTIECRIEVSGSETFELRMSGKAGTATVWANQTYAQGQTPLSAFGIGNTYKLVKILLE